MFPYIECPLSELSTEENLLNLLSEDNSLLNKEKMEKFLCYIRLMCSNFLEKELEGSPSFLLRTHIKPTIENTSHPSELNEILDDILGILQALEVKQESFFIKIDALQQLQRCYRYLKELLQKIKDTTTTKIEYSYKQDTCKITETLAVTKNLFSEDIRVFFEAFTYTFENYCETLSSQKYFKKTAWENRVEHHWENNLTEKLCSYLDMALKNYSISLVTQKKCGDGVADMQIILENGTIIPVEAKTSEHEKLWEAIEKQLIDTYMLNIHHYGIYLVYWFGKTNLKAPPRKLCSKPNSHSELQSSLVTHCIPESHKDKIKVFCIDCS